MNPLKSTNWARLHTLKIAILLALTTGTLRGIVVTESICVCDRQRESRNRVLSSRPDENPKVEFRPANIKGEDYIRPSGASRSLDLPPRYSLLSAKRQKAAEALESVEGGVEDSVELCSSEQVHLTLGNYADSVIVSYASFQFNTANTVEYSASIDDLMSPNSAAAGSHAVHVTDEQSLGGGVGVPNIAYGTKFAFSNKLYVSSRLLDPNTGEPSATEEEVLARQNTASWAYDKATGEHYSNYFNVTSVEQGDSRPFYTGNPYAFYDSPLLFQAELTGLAGGETYFYRVAGSCTLHQFTMPPLSSSSASSNSASSNSASSNSASSNSDSSNSAYPFMAALTADVGQTSVSAATFAAILELKPSVVLFAGDLSYADGWIYRWDSFGRAVENLASSVPLLTTGGNHEVASGENWMSYYWRYPTPHKASNSPNPCYWGREVGVLNVISLCSYAGFNETSLQYQWLESYLETSIDRALTPWVLVMLHVPFYSSNSGHWREGELMRLSVEPLLYQYGVDMVLAGHVHSYERTYPVFNGELDDCGPTYINLGDGGNYEGMYTAWRFDRPEWSAFREASFGVGHLTVVNSTHALYHWHRHACGSDDASSEGVDFSDDCVTPGDNSSFSMLTSDTQYIVRPQKSSCSNRYVSTSNGSSMRFSSSSDSSSRGDSGGGGSDITAGNSTSADSEDQQQYSCGTGMSTALTTMIILFALSAMVNIFTIGYMLHERNKRLGGNNSTLLGTLSSHHGRAATGILGQRRSSYHTTLLMDDSTHADADADTDDGGILLQHVRGRSDSSASEQDVTAVAASAAAASVTALTSTSTVTAAAPLPVAAPAPTTGEQAVSVV